MGSSHHILGSNSGLQESMKQLSWLVSYLFCSKKLIIKLYRCLSSGTQYKGIKYWGIRQFLSLKEEGVAKSKSSHCETEPVWCWPTSVLHTMKLAHIKVPEGLRVPQMVKWKFEIFDPEANWPGHWANMEDQGLCCKSPRVIGYKMGGQINFIN